MLNWIIGASLRFRMLVLAAALLVAACGIYTALRMPIEVLPDLSRPTVVVLTEVPGRVPEDVERLVTRPVEQAVNGATGVTRVRSTSAQGLSTIWVEFGWGSDIFRNRQVIQEKLQLAAPRLPPGLQPQMAPIGSLMGVVQIVTLRSRSGATPVDELRALTDQTVRARLLSVPGVAQVAIVGGAPRQLQIIVDADKLRAFDATLKEVADAARGANLAAFGGILNMGSKGPAVSMTGLVQSAGEMGSAVVKPGSPRPVRLEDVAKIEFGPAAVRSGEAGVNAGPGVQCAIYKQPGTDTIALTQRIGRALADVQSTLPPDVEIVTDVFQLSAFIDRAISNIEAAVRDGAILVVIVLFLFLLNFRTTLITLTAIPLSVAITALVFAAFGLTINTMTLGGLAVAIGALVDDAIVDVENVFRRLRQNAASEKPRNALLVIFRASSEVRNPILIGTLLVVIVYLPLFFLAGMEGRLFTPIGVAYIISTLASLAVSLTVTPALCYYLLGKQATTTNHEPRTTNPHADTWLVRHLKRAAGWTIRHSMAHPMPILGMLLASVLVCLLILTTRGSEFLPAFNEGTVQVGLILPPGTSLDTTDGYARRLEKLLVGVKGVQTVGRRTGRADADEENDDINQTEAIVTFDPKAGRTREEIIGEIRAKVADEFPGAATDVEQPLAHMLSHVLSGVNAQVAVKIYGQDLEVLRRAAADAEAALRPIPGVKDLRSEGQALIDHVVAQPRREQLARAGLNVQEIAETVELAMGGEEVSRMTVGQYSYPIVVRLAEKDRRDLESIRDLPVHTVEGGRLRLSDVAEVFVSKTPHNINRENVSRRIVVQHNVAGRSLSEVVADVERALEPVRKRLAAQPGYSLQISGQFEAQAEAERVIFILSFVSLAAMFFILFAHFRSLNLALQVLLSIPMAFIGAVAYIAISGQTLSVATLVGLVSLGGIAARNAILLLDHYLHLMREEAEPFSQEMIVRAGQERMVPVLMTALCSGIALVPLALSPGEPGREILYPVATVIIGGLISSTLLDFLVTPAVFWTFGRKDAEELASERHSLDKATEAMAEEFDDQSRAHGHAAPPIQGGIAHG